MNIIEKLKIEDTSDKLKNIYKVIGKEKFIELLETMGGNKLYIPQKENFELRVISRLVYEENIAGKTVSELANKYMLDVRTVRKYIRVHKKGKL